MPVHGVEGGLVDDWQVEKVVDLDPALLVAGKVSAHLSHLGGGGGCSNNIIGVTLNSLQAELQLAALCEI